MNFIDLYINGYTLEYIASKNACDITEVQEALVLACGLCTKTKTIEPKGEQIIRARSRNRSIAQISKELKVNLLKITSQVIADIRIEETKTLKYTVFPVENKDQCPCCKTTSWLKRVVLPESNDVTGNGKTKGMYCINCGSEYVIRGNMANVLNWDYIKRLYS